MRDYFAAHAPAMPAGYHRHKWYADEVHDMGNGNKRMKSTLKEESEAVQIARWRFEYADSMMAERVRNG